VNDPFAAATDRAGFARTVREWFAEHAPTKGSAEDFSAIQTVTARTADEYREREHAAMETTRGWQRTLHAAGLTARGWPVEYGGHGAPAWHDEVIADEQTRWGVGTKMLAIALEMAPAVLFAHGTHEQRLAHLPRIVRGDESWCQLLSEPDAGSDLTSVATIATPVDGGWSVTGQKVWTSGAGSSDYALLIARTDRATPGRDGLSCFAMAMDQPGVTVRPLRQMSGAYHFNEVFLDGAFVPTDGLIGALGGGWAVLRTMLASERRAIGGGTSARSATALLALARQLGRNHHPVDRQQLATTYIRERVLDLFLARLAGGAPIPAGGPAAKLLYSEHARLTAGVATRLLGAAATAGDPVAEPWVERLLFAPGLRLGGGTDEIQRNTIGEHGLGLPRQPRA